MIDKPGEGSFYSTDVLAVDAAAVPIRWEPSRGGALFPHLYQPLPTTAVLWQHPLELEADGRHLFPPDM